MPYTRFENIKEEKRNRILRTALAEFTEKNFEAASINQISKKAGLSAGALYYYFEDKEDLFYTTITFAAGQIWHSIGPIEEIFKTHGYWDGITALVEKRMRLAGDHPEAMGLFSRVLTSTDPVEQKGRKQFMKPLRDIFEYGYANGYVRTDVPKELLFDIHLNMTLIVNKWSMNQGAIEQDDSWNVQNMAKRAVDMIRGAIGQEERP